MLLFALLVGAVEVESAQACPAAQAVSDRLRVLMPASHTGGAPDRARLWRAGDRLQLELRRADGTAIAWRRLDARASCEDLAEAAAVMIATWETEVETGRPLPPPEFDRDAPPVPVETVDKIGPPVATPGRVRWELGVGFAASVAGGAFLPGAILDVAAARRGSRWAVRMALVATESREEPFGMGTARWNRLLFAAGPSWRAAPGVWLLDLHAEAVGALVHVEGVGYTTTHDEYGFDPGIGAGVRLALPPAPLVPWVGLSTIGWLRREELRVDGLAGAVALPNVDVLVTAGISFGVAR